MNVNVLQAQNPYINGLNNANRVKGNAPRTPISIEKALAQPNNIAISASELQYFKNLFPESATQIEKYVSFNRNGNITEANLSKGAIIDGRI